MQLSPKFLSDLADLLSGVAAGDSSTERNVTSTMTNHTASISTAENGPSSLSSSKTLQRLSDLLNDSGHSWNNDARLKAAIERPVSISTSIITATH